ncbi:MAG: addiction module protein [Gemmataceae bacterium]
MSTTTFETLYQGSLALSPTDRALLAEKILQSIEPVSLSPDWRAEIEERLQQLESGAVEGIPHEEVMWQARENRRRGRQASS